MNSENFSFPIFCPKSYVKDEFQELFAEYEISDTVPNYHIHDFLRFPIKRSSNVDFGFFSKMENFG